MFRVHPVSHSFVSFFSSGRRILEVCAGQGWAAGAAAVVLREVSAPGAATRGAGAADAAVDARARTHPGSTAGLFWFCVCEIGPNNLYAMLRLLLLLHRTIESDQIKQTPAFLLIFY